MGKPKNIYYYNARKMIQRYPTIKNEKTPYAMIYTRAIEKTIEATKAMDDGEMRLKAMDMIFFKNTHTAEGAALQLYVNYAKVREWVSDFVNAVIHANVLYSKLEREE